MKKKQKKVRLSRVERAEMVLQRAKAKLKLAKLIERGMQKANG